MIKIAIVGRPNVGKSTLFNRLLHRRIAIVDRVSGVTRDRLYGEADWNGRKFTIIDTGGADFDKKDIIKKLVLEQIKISIKEADILFFVTDITTGVVPLDKEIDKIIRQSGKKVILVVNKIDNEKLEVGIPAFSELGWDKMVGISAAHGLGANRLLELAFKEFPEIKEEKHEIPSLRVAIVGRPNVGKSTFVNAVLDEARMIVHERPGTTRDAVDVKFIRNKEHWLFIDTAGVRKKKQVRDPLEYYSVTRVFTSIDRSDAVIFMIDGWEGLRSQDAQLIDYIIEKGKPCILGVNKWDLVKEVTKGDYTERIENRMREYRYVPPVFLSALKKENVDAVLEKVEKLIGQSRKKITTRALNKFIQTVEMVKPLKIYYGTQVGVNPPSFVLFSNVEPRSHSANYIKNKLHETFDFEVPIKVEFRPRKVKETKTHGK
jgi:GTP-binding protein